MNFPGTEAIAEIIEELDGETTSPVWRELGEACSQLGISMECLPCSAVCDDGEFIMYSEDEKSAMTPIGAWRLSTSLGLSCVVSLWSYKGLSLFNHVEVGEIPDCLTELFERVSAFVSWRLRWDAGHFVGSAFEHVVMLVEDKFNGRDIAAIPKPESDKPRIEMPEYVANDDAVYAYAAYRALESILEYGPMPFVSGGASGFIRMGELGDVVRLLSGGSMSCNVPMLDLNNLAAPLSLDIEEVECGYENLVLLLSVWDSMYSVELANEIAQELDLPAPTTYWLRETHSIMHFGDVIEHETEWMDFCSKHSIAEVLETARVGVPVEDIIA